MRFRGGGFTPDGALGAIVVTPLKVSSHFPRRDTSGIEWDNTQAMGCGRTTAAELPIATPASTLR
jgi:hypothetical protein